MLFAKKLRPLVKSGEITLSVRIWQKPKVRLGGFYRLDRGCIEIRSLREVSLDYLTDRLARDTGFNNLVDLLKTAKHGSGQRVFLVGFCYHDSPPSRLRRSTNAG